MEAMPTSRLLVFAAVVSLTGATVLLAAEPAAPSLSTARVVDLTYPFDEKTIYWPTSPSGFELKSLAHGQTPGGWFYSSNSFCTPEHGGTHLDAPIHFAADGRTADQIPVRQLIAPAAVIDVRAKASATPVPS
jgi:kynurenine formamidase